MMGLSYGMAIRYSFPRETIPLSPIIIWKEFVSAGPALMAPVIILGGILGGVFTPTEAAAIAVLYAFILGKFIYRELTLKDMADVFIQSGITTAVLLLIIGMASIFAWVLTSEQIPTRIAQAMLALTTNPYTILMLINLFLIFIGMFLEGGAAIIILAPTLLQVTNTVGIDPLHFSLIMVLNLAVGLLTPPLGVCLFVVCGVTRIDFSAIVLAILPFLAVEISVLLVATYFSWLILSIPKLLGYV
jgi:tripartite ATP-independent transporter DctM subunit